jgi:hypothetical protein
VTGGDGLHGVAGGREVTEASARNGVCEVKEVSVVNAVAVVNDVNGVRDMTGVHDMECMEYM